MFIQILILIILTAINAFFAAAEMAIVSVNKNKIHRLAQEGNKKAIMIENLYSNPSNFLSTIQIGITLTSFFASAYASTGISGSLASLLKSMAIPYANQIALIAVTLILSYATLVFGELFPKRLALGLSEQIAMFTISPIVFISKVSLPFVKFLTFSVSVLTKLFHIDTDDLEEKLSLEEIKSMIETGKETGVINEIEQEMIESIFDFDDKIAEEIMTPRTDVFMIDINETDKDLITLIMNESFSRIPVYSDDVDDIVGILHMKDIYKNCFNMDYKDIDIKSLMREPFFVPETIRIDKLFKKLQKNKNHMAILVDEYGGFSGIVTMEDLIEEIMGNISDEFDDAESLITKIDDHTFEAYGHLTIDDFNDAFELNIISEYSDTIGGLILTLIGKIPTKKDIGEIIKYENIKFIIKDFDKQRVKKLTIIFDEKIKYNPI